MDLEAELRKEISEDQLELQIAQKIESFHGLLTREVAIRLIAKESGLLKEKEKTFKLGEIPKGERKISFRAKVKKIWPIAKYASGKKSRVVEVKDESGTMPLILWNEDVNLAARLRSRDEIEVKGAYERSGELHLSYSGELKTVEEAEFTSLEELRDGEYVHVRGRICRLDGFDAFVHGMNTSKGFSFMITDGKIERRVIIWEEPERGEKLREGDEVMIEDGLVNNSNIDLSSDARILARRNMLIGQVGKFECEGEILHMEVNGKELVLERKNALRVLGVDVAEDISLSTIAALKKDNIINNRIALRIENGQVKKCLH
jgi:hypothetical protein